MYCILFLQNIWYKSITDDCCLIYWYLTGIEQVLKNQQKNFDFAAALAVGILRLDDENNSSAWSILDSQKGRGKIRDMVLSSSQATIKFFSKRASCSCLDEMAARVKKEARMGTCIHCDKQSECKSMYLCGNCKIHQYVSTIIVFGYHLWTNDSFDPSLLLDNISQCCKKCQKEAWPEHKPICAKLCKRFNKNEPKEDKKETTSWNLKTSPNRTRTSEYKRKCNV